MARSARAVLPIDLLALVSYNGKVYPNEARPRELLGAVDPTPNPIETAFEQWFSFATRRNAWISASRRRLLGLVSARRRGGRQAWEIDCLIDTTAARDAVSGLLECAMRAAGRSAAEKVFLRLSANSPLLPVVMNAGFTAYQSERLYAGSALAVAGEEVPLRPFTQQDLYPAYRLYNATMPERTRRAEGSTFGEWQAAQEKHWLKAGAQLVLESEGGLAAEVRVGRLPHGLLAEIIAGAPAIEDTRGLLATAVKAAGSGLGRLMVLVPESAPAIASQLEDLGFDVREEFICLMARTTRLARMPKLAPQPIPNGAVIT
ncbi:MAG TPA: hypothetical protein VNN10_02235 [Dehalococcoidia bacterium]|nr:hypothetical protein [Dehalococcoidia bacterium]